MAQGYRQRSKVSNFLGRFVIGPAHEPDRARWRARAGAKADETKRPPEGGLSTRKIEGWNIGSLTVDCGIPKIRLDKTSTTRENSMPRGKIKMYNDDKGFGFIRPDNGDPDVFFHVSSLREGEEIAIGKEVTFETGVDPKSGKLRATAVDLV
jgi:CspA family cold shock protein